MERNKYIILLLIGMLYGYEGISQTNRYVVYFKDKTNSQYSISEPSAYLSAKAITRRENQNIEITTDDLPVNQSYVTGIQDLGVQTYFTSKWLNAVLVEATASEIDLIEDESYVSKTTYAAPGQKLSATPEAENTTRASEPPSNSRNYNSDVQLNMLEAKTMHEEGITGEGVWIAVLDDGFIDANRSAAFSHVFENDKLKDVFDFISGGKNVFQYDDHGTSSWSCFGAKYESTLVGTAYNADISLYVTEDVFTEFRIEEYNWLFAAERADSAGVDIITSSLGYSDFDDASMNYAVEDLDGQTSIVSQAANFALERGMLVVLSAGNSGGSNSWPYISMPGDVEEVIAVGALNDDYNLVGFSSIGPTADNRIKPEVVALGEGVTLLGAGNFITKKDGTSFAAPLIAGLAAGIWQKFPTLTNSELRDLILASSDNFNDPDNRIGYGLPDYNIAVGNEPLSVSELIDQGIKIFPNPVQGDHINLLIERSTVPRPITFTLFSPQGQLISQQTIRNSRKHETVNLDFHKGGQGFYVLSIQCRAYTKKVKILRY